MADEQNAPTADENQQTDDQQTDTQTADTQDNDEQAQDQGGQADAGAQQTDDQGDDDQGDDGFYMPHRGGNVPADEVYTEWKRSQEYIKKLEAERGGKTTQDQPNLPDGTQVNEDEVKAVRQALGIDEDAIRAAAREEYMKAAQQEQVDKQIQEQAKEARDTFNGKGEYADMPKFNFDKALAHAVQKGFRNLKDAHIDLHQSEWVEHLINKRLKDRPAAPQTDRNDAPDDAARPNKDKMLDELRKGGGSDDAIFQVLRRYMPTKSSE